MAGVTPDCPRCGTRHLYLNRDRKRYYVLCGDCLGHFVYSFESPNDALLFWKYCVDEFPNEVCDNEYDSMRRVITDFPILRGTVSKCRTCGNEHPLLTKASGKYMLSCADCETRTPMLDTKNDAILFWNVICAEKVWFAYQMAEEMPNYNPLRIDSVLVNTKKLGFVWRCTEKD